MKKFFSREDFFFLLLVIGLGFGVSIPYIRNPREVLGFISILVIGFALAGMLYVQGKEIFMDFLKWLERRSQKNV